MLRSIAAVGHDSGFDEPGRPVAGDRAEPGARPAVLTAIKLIQDRYFEPLTLAKLASEVFISRFHFSRMFADATGVTPGRFLTAVRLFEAQRLLLTPGMPAADVLVGLFADPVPQCGPVAFGGAAGMSSGELRLTGVPAGHWTAIAAARHRVVGDGGSRFSIGYSAVQVGAQGLSTG